MFCPNPDCPDLVASGVPGEYRQGIARCPVCGVDLVDGDPRQRVDEMPNAAADAAEPPFVVAVAEVDEPAEIDVVRSVLEGAEIPFVVEGGDRREAYRAGHALHRFHPLFGTLRFLVPQDYAEEARALLTVVDDAADLEPDPAIDPA